MAHTSKNDMQLLIEHIIFVTHGKGSMHHLIGLISLQLFANENLLQGFPVRVNLCMYIIKNETSHPNCCSGRSDLED